MPQFTDYPVSTRFDAGDILLKDGTAGTKKILVPDAAVEFAGMVSAINHRNVYRGRNLGSTVTAEQKAAIQNGTFDNLFTGDYWRINNIDWVVADMDYWYNIGDTAFLKHHLVIVPGKGLYVEKMNETNTTDGGYALSYMRTQGLNQAKQMAHDAFGDMVLTHDEYLVNAVTNGRPVGGAWFDSDVELMDEIMAYGCPAFSVANDGTNLPENATFGRSQLALFRLNPKALNVWQAIWLRDIVSATHFALKGQHGLSGVAVASTLFSVRPAFPIG